MIEVWGEEQWAHITIGVVHMADHVEFNPCVCTGVDVLGSSD